MFKRIATAGLIPALIVSTVLLVAFIAPAGASGINGVASADCVAYSTGVPGIRSVSPNHGTTAGGTSVVIGGIHFNGSTSVVFGGSSASSFTINSDSQITAVSPVHSAGIVNVHVTNPCGTSATTTVDRYTFTPSTVNACTSASLSASPVSFALEGSTVTLTASSTGCPNPEYMFFLALPGSPFRAVTGFGGATFAWNTTGARDGVWGIGVWVRQIGSGASHQAYYIGSYKILANCIAAQLNASPASPQARGTVVTLQGFTTLCTHPRYRFFILTRNMTHWSSFGAFSASSSVNWNTAGYAAGPWRLLVEARQLGSIHTYDTFAVITFYVS